MPPIGGHISGRISITPRYMHRKGIFEIALIAILSFVFFGNTAFADYSAFQNHLVSTSGPDNVNTAMSSSGSNDVFIEYIATSTVTLFDRLDVALCRNSGTAGGSIHLEVRTSASTTGPIIASSTLAINDGNVYSTTTTPGQYCNYGIEGVNQHMGTFVLNNTVQWVSGVTIWFRFRLVNSLGDIYFSLNNGNTFGFGNNLYLWRNNAVLKTNYGADYASPIVTGYALGSVPANQNQGIYNASTTASVCTSFDIGCYISTGLAWAFYPTIPISEQLAELGETASDQVPFGYVVDIYDKFAAYSTTGTTSLNISVELSGLMNFMGGTYGSTSMTIISGTGLRNTLGTSMWNFIQNILKALLWFSFAIYVYRRSIKLL